MKVLRAIDNCRTAALGGHRRSSARMRTYCHLLNSCRNRHCPKCQGQARERWLAARERELLPTHYFHVVFTLPHELTARSHCRIKRRSITCCFTPAPNPAGVARDPTHLGAEIGFFSVLHTWGPELLYHPHVHCVVPQAVSPRTTRAGSPSRPLLLPAREGAQSCLPRQVCRQASRPPLCAAALARSTDISYRLRNRERLRRMAAGTVPSRLGGLLPNRLSAGPNTCCAISAAYTHRVAISNSRLVALATATSPFAGATPLTATRSG